MNQMPSRVFVLMLLGLLTVLVGRRALAAPAELVGGVFATPLAADDLDPGAFAAWTDGKTDSLPYADGPRHGIWTQTSHPEWDGVNFGESKRPGVRHLRIGFKRPLTLGTILVRGGGRLSVLRPQAAYPGNLADDRQWVPAERLKGGQISNDEVGQDEFAVWILPPQTSTRALRFTHVAAPTETTYHGWLGGAFVLSRRMVNLAPTATVTTGSRNDAAARLNDESNNKTWGTWDNGPDGGTQVVSAAHPEWVLLTLPHPERLDGVNLLWPGFSAAEVQTYIGPSGRHPRERSSRIGEPLRRRTTSKTCTRCNWESTGWAFLEP